MAISLLVLLLFSLGFTHGVPPPYPSDPFPLAPCVEVGLYDLAHPIRSLIPPPAPRAFLQLLANAEADPSFVQRNGCLRSFDRDEARGDSEPWRLVVGIALGVRFELDVVELEKQPLVTTLIPGIAASLSPNYAYRFYFAYDLDDRYNSAAVRERAEALLMAAVATMPLAERPFVSVHWVLCLLCSGKPAHAHSLAATAAFVEGAEYVFRVNDDTVLPRRDESGDWTKIFIDELLSRKIPNLGVTGPEFSFEAEDPTPVLSHDFTHKTHARLFGFQYPPSLPDWSSDDWITFIYDMFNFTTKLAHVKVVHKTGVMRYEFQVSEVRRKNLKAELPLASDIIQSYARSLGIPVAIVNHKTYDTV